MAEERGGLTFDAVDHAYAWNGRPVPSVTQILKPLSDFAAVSKDVMERARVLGTRVHLATELDDRRQLDEDETDSRLMGYVEAWRAWKDSYQFDPITIEAPVYHPVHKYAGTPDRIGYARGEVCVVDIKRVHTIDPVVDVQTAAYAKAWDAQNPNVKVVRTMAVKLDADGLFRCRLPASPNNAFSTFLACLQVHRWKENAR